MQTVRRSPAIGFSIVSNLAIGLLSDRMDSWIIITGSLVGTSSTVFILWGALSPSPAVLSIFGVTYGIFAGGWCALWSPFLRRFTRNCPKIALHIAPMSLMPFIESHPSLSTPLFGLFMFFRGLGNILSTPIATALIHSDKGIADKGGIAVSGFKADNSRYEDVIVYVGICFSVAALVSIVGWRLEKRISAST